jgi:hypothetical protein
MESAMALPPETALPDRIANWIRSEGGDHALLLITVDAYLRPHPVMLARDEVFVVSPMQLRVAIGEATRTAENLRLRSSSTLAIYDAGLACVIKTRTAGGPRSLLPGTVAYDLAVEDVRFDTPAAAEASARLVTGLRFEGRAEHRDIRAALEALDRN